jgi:hypothetical protein
LLRTILSLGNFSPDAEQIATIESIEEIPSPVKNKR